MKDVFVIRNQYGQFLGKQGQWLDESEPALVWRSPHRDIALNYLIENNAHDIEQRLDLLQCPLNQKDIPLLGDAAPPGKTTPVTFDEPDVVVEPDVVEPDVVELEVVEPELVPDSELVAEAASDLG